LCEAEAGVQLPFMFLTVEYSVQEKSASLVDIVEKG
jgi:hypothetical protein